MPLGNGRLAPLGNMESSAEIQAEDGQSVRLPQTLLQKTLTSYMDEMTRIRVLHALDKTGWRKQEAADQLGIDRATLYRQMKKLNLLSQR